MDDPIELAREGGERLGVCDIGKERVKAGGGDFGPGGGVPAEAIDFMSEPGEFRAQGHADVSATNDKTFHGNKSEVPILSLFDYSGFYPLYFYK
jgi:hypothetical protein